jgi:hypothetical protein
VLRSLTTGLVGIVALLMVLDELGYSLAPLLASAGIAGVALGFGAQTLVRDFLSGVFMIVEDQYGVGDSVDLGEAIGTVESVGLRVTKVRDVEGTLWHVRNGEIVRVGNKSQGWARAVLDVTIAYGEDVDRVKALLLEVAQEVTADPEYAALVLEEPEMWGVESVTSDGIVLRLVIKTQPLQQWTIARETRRRIKERFDDEGVQVPPPQRGILVATGPNGNGWPGGNGGNGGQAPVGQASATDPGSAEVSGPGTSRGTTSGAGTTSGGGPRDGRTGPAGGDEPVGESSRPGRTGHSRSAAEAASSPPATPDHPSGTVPQDPTAAQVPADPTASQVPQDPTATQVPADPTAATDTRTQDPDAPQSPPAGADAVVEVPPSTGKRTRRRRRSSGTAGPGTTRPRPDPPEPPR